MRPVPLLLVVAPLASACVSERGPLTNHMAQMSTQYLTRAARQPIAWQPWGREAFALAARLDRPVLLYVGAEECRWCAVMDRESYGDPALGHLIDSLFVPVRLDRDERPDVAQGYEAAVQSLSGLRGYPLTVFLTPDGAAFFGGTYFPADDPVTGRGLKQILPDIARSYREQRQSIVQHAALVRQLALAENGTTPGVLSADGVQRAIGRVRAALVELRGRPDGLGGFVPTQAVGLLLAEYALNSDTSGLQVARETLDALLDSAGPAAASTDEPPALVRAGLARDLAVAWALTAEPRYRDAAAVELRSLTHTLGAGGGGNDERPLFADREAFVIGATLDAAGALGDSVAQQRALAALDTLLKRVYARGFGVRHAVAGAVHGLLQDQAEVAAASLAAYSATGKQRYLDVAKNLAAVVERDFADPQGGYFDAAAPDASAPGLSDRTKQVFDDLLPGANATVARVQLRLAAVTGDAGYRRRARATLEAFAGGLDGAGLRASTYLAVAREALLIR
jgi:uncharacterized protein YyaL (SSP411 family)